MLEFPKTIVCKWCDQELENDPGAYYHQKSCEANWCLDELEFEEDPERRRHLKAQLERARYTGD